MSQPIRVGVVDDHPMVLRGTCDMIDGADDMEVVARGRDGEEALLIARDTKPDVMLLDIHMPKRDGIAVVTELRARKESAALLMLSSANDEASILRALQAGANGYLLKTATEEQIQQAVRLVAKGEPALVQPEVAKAVMAAWRGPDSTVEALSEREVTIVRTLAKDLSNKEIAARLGISDRTVQQHLSHIFSKLGAASRTGAVLKALQLGLISLEDARQ